jgi:hypothetical protein
MSFLKLDESILTSTLWLDRTGRDVLIAAGLKARPRNFSEPVPVYAASSTDGPIYTLPPGEYGFTECSGPGLVNLAGHNPSDPKDWAEGMAALKRLTEPDPDSRDPSYEGRRLARVDGGYIVLSLMKYREKDSTAAERKRRQRERERESRRHGVTPRDVTQGRREKGDVRRKTERERKERKDGGHGSKEGTPASTAASLPPSVSHDDYRQERERLAEEITALATAIATEACVDLAMVVRLASRMDAKNGHPENEGFADPRTCPSLAWLQTTLAKLPQVRAQLTRPVPL